MIERPDRRLLGVRRKVHRKLGKELRIAFQLQRSHAKSFLWGCKETISTEMEGIKNATRAHDLEAGSSKAPKI